MPKRKRTSTSAHTQDTTGAITEGTTLERIGTTAADDRETSQRALGDIAPILCALADIKSTKSQLRIYGEVTLEFTHTHTHTHTRTHTHAHAHTHTQ